MADSFFSAGKIVLMKNLILENDIARKNEKQQEQHGKFMNDDDFLLTVTHLPGYCACTYL